MYKKKKRKGSFNQTHKVHVSIGENSYISRLTGFFIFVNNMIKVSQVSNMMSISGTYPKVSGSVALCTVWRNDLNKQSSTKISSYLTHEDN